MTDDVALYESLSKVAKAVNKRHKLEVAIPGKDPVKADVKHWIPTASTLLNLLMGEENCGVATGRIYELFGDFSHGKSTLDQIIRNAFQAAGGVSVLLDAESSWNRERAVQMGHMPDRHLAVEVDTCEMGFEVIDSTISEFKSRFGDSRPVIFSWDTIAASPTEGEKKGEEYSAGMMFKARLIRRELKRLCQELDKINGAIVFVNQTIEGPKPNRSGVKTTPGGGGIKFWSSQRLQVFKVGAAKSFEDKTKQTGILTNVKMVKNKLFPPFKDADIPLDFNLGLDPVREVTNYLLDNTDAYNINGAYRSVVGFQDQDIKFYERDMYGILEKFPGMFEWMVERVKMHWLGLD